MEKINPTEALRRIQANVNVLPTVQLPIRDAIHHSLATDITSAIQLPPFDASAMDGYAINLENTSRSWSVYAENPAGSGPGNPLLQGEARRIFTGAPVPPLADTVVMQEHAHIENGQLTFQPLPAIGANIRKAGSHIQKGQTIFKAGSILNAASLGVLSSIGVFQVPVVRLPKVGILVTGNEVVFNDRPLQPGQIYDGNLITLEFALKQFGITSIETKQAEDHPDAIRKAIEQLLENYDLLLVSGGVSVGDYDFVVPALSANKVLPIFHGISQKPGKPLFFGTKEEKVIFGLPGNPVSVLSCFYLYVWPALQQLSGQSPSGLPQDSAKITHTLKRKPGLTQFYRGIEAGGRVSIPSEQDSHQLLTFAHANVIVEIPAELAEVSEGTEVQIRRLP